MYEISLNARLTLLISSTLTVMAGATVAPSLPLIAETYSHLPHIDILNKLVLALPALVIALSGPFIGRVIDKFGRVRFLVIGLATYGISGVSAFFIDDLYLILVGRAFLGMAVAIIMTVTNTLIGDLFRPDIRSKFLGLQGVFMAMGGVVFVGTSGFLADLNWRYPFLIYLLALTVIPLAISSLPEPDKGEREVPTNKYRPSPRQYMIFSLAFIGMLFFYMIPVQVPFLLREMGIQTNALSGVAIATTTLFGIVTSSRYSKLLDRFTFAQIYVFIFAFGGIGYGLAAITQSYAVLIAAMAISGLAFGTLMPNTNMWLISESNPFNRGRIIGILTFSFFSGQFFSPIVLRPIALSGGLSTAFGVAAIFMLVLATVLQFTYVRLHPK